LDNDQELYEEDRVAEAIAGEVVKKSTPINKFIEMNLCKALLDWHLQSFKFVYETFPAIDSQTRRRIASKPLPSLEPLEMSGFVETLDDVASGRAGPMGLKSRSRNHRNRNIAQVRRNFAWSTASGRDCR
jgi:hypothetical protein